MKFTAAERKERPLFSGVLRYFPKALMEVARTSYLGNEQHNPGQPLHWDRSKSTDEADALVRHLLQAGEIDTDGVRHTAKVAWRALALLEKELEGAIPDREESLRTAPASAPNIPSGNMGGSSSVFLWGHAGSVGEFTTAPVASATRSDAGIALDRAQMTYDEKRAAPVRCHCGRDVHNGQQCAEGCIMDTHPHERKRCSCADCR